MQRNCQIGGRKAWCCVCEWGLEKDPGIPVPEGFTAAFCKRNAEKLATRWQEVCCILRMTDRERTWHHNAKVCFCTLRKEGWKTSKLNILCLAEINGMEEQQSMELTTDFQLCIKWWWEAGAQYWACPCYLVLMGGWSYKLCSSFCFWSCNFASAQKNI